MNELEAVSKLLQSLGISGLFAPFIATIAIFYLFKKYILAGSGDFLRQITGEYLKQNNERIALETRIDIRLGGLTDSLEKFVAQLVDMEKRSSERISQIRTELSERITTVEVVLSDKVFSELNEIKDSLSEHFDDFADTVEGKHTCKQRIALMDTQEFRTKREEARKELIK